MKNPDEDTLKAIINISGDLRWEKILNWIKDSRDEVVSQLSENTIFNAGRAAELWDLIKKIEEARETLKKMGMI